MMHSSYNKGKENAAKINEVKKPEIDKGKLKKDAKKLDEKIGKVSERVTQAKTKQVKKGLPDWLKERFNQGNQFNKDNRPRYEYNEVRVTKDGNEFRVDSYNRNSEIVSRKFTQLGEIKEETAISYLNELDKKYSPGTEIINGAFNPKELGGLTLEGQMILEIPVQKYDIPAKVLEKAKELHIVIRDVEGKVYK